DDDACPIVEPPGDGGTEARASACARSGAARGELTVMLSSASQLEHGTVVAGYRVEGMLGRGGMGVVYEATQLSLGRVVALKVLSHDLSDDPAFRERFRREGLVQATVDHPNIVPVLEAGELDNGLLFLAM